MPEPDLTFRFDVHVHQDGEAKLDRIINLLQAVLFKEARMSAELDALSAQVAATNTVEQSAITLLEGIAAQLAAIKDDPAKIEALATSLKAQSDSLAAAVAANTPAGPTPPAP